VKRKGNGDSGKEMCRRVRVGGEEGRKGRVKEETNGRERR
jgi:hypothetical protein